VLTLTASTFSRALSAITVKEGVPSMLTSTLAGPSSWVGVNGTATFTLLLKDSWNNPVRGAPAPILNVSGQGVRAFSRVFLK
jgi:hypothetical protein